MLCWQYCKHFVLRWAHNWLLQFRALNLKLNYSGKTNESGNIFRSVHSTEIILHHLFRIVIMYACLQLWRLNCVASLCFFLSAGVENGHVSTNSALRMLFRFMFRVMLQCLLRKLMVLQHIENLNAVSVVRGTSPCNRVAVATCVLIPEKEVLCIDTSTFPSSCYASCPVYFSLLHPWLLFIYHLHIVMELAENTSHIIRLFKILIPFLTHIQEYKYFSRILLSFVLQI